MGVIKFMQEKKILLQAILAVFTRNVASSVMLFSYAGTVKH